MIGKKVLPLIFAALIVAFLISSTNAYPHNTLDVNVSCYPEVILPGQDVTITCTANMDGKGIVFVVQPNPASSMANSRDGFIQMALNKISSDSDGLVGRIISYALVVITKSGGSCSFTFPKDFKGLNGVPSTNKLGKYYVFFVFVHSDICCLCKKAFDCSSFFVVPELPIGTLMAITASLGALFGYVAVKRLRTKRCSPLF